MSILLPTRRPLLGSPFNAFDRDAQTYIRAVEAADGQPLEAVTRSAINQFIVGCKQDGIWDAIKASCILAGARTLAGCLVPLKGTAPTNFNFVAGDYNRKTGLKGNGSTKSLSTNTNTSQLSTQSMSAWLSTVDIFQGVYLGTYNSVQNTVSQIARLEGVTMTFTRTTNSNSISNRIAGSSLVGFVGASLVGTQQTHRSGGGNIVGTLNVQPDPGSTFGVFGRQTQTDSFAGYSDARLAFYSIGESLNLALLDARVTALINAFAALP